MNSLLLRLVIIKSNKEYNVLFDTSFSLNDNLKLLENIIDENFDKCFIYDNKLNIFLDKNISLDSLNIPSSRTLYIY